jgi:two-component system response regulator MprA
MTEQARVLVVDDDQGVRVSVARILSNCGYDVAEAEDGQQALDQLAATEVDAVVLDVKMPRKDGIAVLEELLPEPPPPGVLLVSAYDIDRETRSRLGTRVHKILRKPVPPPTLIEAVSAAVDVARSARSA